MKKFFASRIYKLINIALLLFPLIAILSFIAMITDIYKYQGFFKKHLLIDSLTLFNILLCTGLFINFFSTKKVAPVFNRLENLLYHINFLILPLLVVAYIYFNDLLIERGLNYVFATYHIQPQNIPPLIFLSAFILFTYLYRKIPDKLT